MQKTCQQPVCGVRHNVYMQTPLQLARKRLWRPRLGLFWLVVLFNVLSSGMTWTLHLADPQGALRWMLALLALTNAAAGWYLLWRLWNYPPDEPSSAPHPHSN